MRQRYSNVSRPNWHGHRATARHPRRRPPERRRPRCNGAAAHVIEVPRPRAGAGGRLRLARRRTTSLTAPPPPRRARRGPGLQVGQCQSRVSGRSETEMGWQPRLSGRKARAPAPSPTDSRSAGRRRPRPFRAALRFMREGAGRVIGDNEEIRRFAFRGVRGDAPSGRHGRIGCGTGLPTEGRCGLPRDLMSRDVTLHSVSVKITLAHHLWMSWLQIAPSASAPPRTPASAPSAGRVRSGLRGGARPPLWRGARSFPLSRAPSPRSPARHRRPV
jgi:hypothetical protein